MAKEIKKSELRDVANQRYLDPFSAMRTEMDRVFDTFLGRGFASLPTSRNLGWDQSLAPCVDVRETEKEFVIDAELPGIKEEDVTVSINNGILTLKGQKKSEREEQEEDYHLMERSYGSFQRSFQFGDTVDSENVKASFEKGILTVTLPKLPEAARTEKRIPVKKG